MIPTLNEAANITPLVASLLAQSPPPAAVVVADGGSRDGTPTLAARAGATVVRSSRTSRAAQMNAGARRAIAASNLAPRDVLLFVHADTRLPRGALRAAARRAAALEERLAVGAFRCAIEGHDSAFYALASAHHTAKSYYLPALLRPKRAIRGLRLFYGDQCLFVRRDVFQAVGGYDERLALMEDADLCVTAHAHVWRANRGHTNQKAHTSEAVCALLHDAEPVGTSARRFERLGCARTTAVQLLVGAMYAVGCSPERLEAVVARLYAPVRE